MGSICLPETPLTLRNIPEESWSYLYRVRSLKPRKAKKACRCKGSAPPVLNLGIICRWWWASHSGRLPQLPNGQEVGWATYPIWAFWRRDKHFAFTGVWTLDLPFCSLGTTLTKLTWLLYDRGTETMTFLLTFKIMVQSLCTRLGRN